MNSLFSMDNPIFTTLGKIYDIMVISIIWTIFSIPIFTMGTSSTALYYATVKVIRRERGYLIREFFKSFKLNFKKGSLITIILILLYIVIYVDFAYARSIMESKEMFAYILFGIFGAISFLLLSVTLYIFPVLSRFEINIKGLFKNSIFFAIRHLPSTIVMLIILIAMGLVIYVIPISILIVPGITALTISLLMERIFKKYITKSDVDEEESGIDEWYLE